MTKRLWHCGKDLKAKGAPQIDRGCIGFDYRIELHGPVTVCACLLKDPEHYPIPACADPRGYWHAVLLRIEAAADHAGTSQGQAALDLAGGVLRQLPALERKLATELEGTVPGLGQSQ